jgi:hypothetical protein
MAQAARAEHFLASVIATTEAQARGSDRRADEPEGAAVAFEGEPMIGSPAWDRCFDAVSGRLMVHWARWLHGFSGSSIGYLLRQFIRRPGVVCDGNETIRVALQPRPLDMVLRIAGYFEPLARVEWAGERRIEIGLAA